MTIQKLTKQFIREQIEAAEARTIPEFRCN